MNIFITGGNGFVGSAACKHFLNQGHHVITLVRDLNNKSQHDILAKCSVVRGDIRDKDLVMSVMSKYEVDYVLHLASSPIVRICNNNPYDAYTTNVIGVLNVLEAARTLINKPKKIVCMTSDKSYGAAPVPYTEETPLEVFDSYCTSKLCQDSIARSYAKTYGLPIVVVRAGNIYGPGDLNMSRLIPKTISRLLKGESPVLYSGVSQYLREFLYVNNIVDAYDILLQNGLPGEVYNIGGTQPQKVIDVINKLRDIVNPEIPVIIEEKEFSEVKEQYLNADKIRSLGWSPKVNLDEGLQNTVEWFKERL